MLCCDRCAAVCLQQTLVQLACGQHCTTFQPRVCMDKQCTRVPNNCSSSSSAVREAKQPADACMQVEWLLPTTAAATSVPACFRSATYHQQNQTTCAGQLACCCASALQHLWGRGTTPCQEAAAPLWCRTSSCTTSHPCQPMPATQRKAHQAGRARI